MILSLLNIRGSSLNNPFLSFRNIAGEIKNTPYNLQKGCYVSVTSFIKKQKYLQHFLILQVFEKTFLSILSYLQTFLHLYLLSDASQHV